MQTQTTENAQVSEAPTFEKVWAMMQEVAKSQKETDRQLSKLGSRFGDMIEEMVKPNLLKKFRELGFAFTKVYKHALFEDENHKFIAEVDFTLENGEKVMLVEVKSKPTTQDISEHLERMGKVRNYADKRNDSRKYLGAIAGMIIHENEKQFALKNGFYVIEPSGDTFNITAPEGGYSPGEW